jgi:hypothetical protein
MSLIESVDQRLDSAIPAAASPRFTVNYLQAGRKRLYDRSSLMIEHDHQAEC